MVSKPEFDELTKREFNKYWRPFFMEMTDEELYTIIFWVTQMCAPAWPVATRVAPPLVNYSSPALLTCS